MTFTRDLGTFDSLQTVWSQYPSGGQAGDYLNVNGRIYWWDSTSENWVMWSQPKQSARGAEVFNGDVHIGNNLTVGGILNARVVYGRDAFCGLYATSTALNTYCPKPLIGQWALVIIENRQVGSLALGEVYYCETDGTWTDAGYQSDVAGIIGQLVAEATARQTADTELQENIDEEAQTREEADATLQQHIDAEAQTREETDTTLQQHLDAEAQTREEEDTTLQQHIDAETQTREEADTTLQQHIDAEAQTREEADTTLSNAINSIKANIDNGYVYAGTANPLTVPKSGKVFYFATERGRYINFGNVYVPAGINILKKIGDTWVSEFVFNSDELSDEIADFEEQVRGLLEDYKPIVIHGDVTNAADEEDLTSDQNNLLKFKDNAYNPLMFSGLGRKILRKNLVTEDDSVSFDGFVEDVSAEGTLEGTPDEIFWDRINEIFVGKKDDAYYSAWTDDEDFVPTSKKLFYMYEDEPYRWDGTDFYVSDFGPGVVKNILTQEVISDENTVYVIRYDFDLNGETITIPENCVLKFEGGSLRNGTLIISDTAIEAERYQIFDNITFTGRIPQLHAENFGVSISNDGATNADNWNAFVRNASDLESVIIDFDNGIYIFSDSIEIKLGMCLRGVGSYGYEVHFSRDLVEQEDLKSKTVLKFNDCDGLKAAQGSRGYLSIENIVIVGSAGSYYRGLNTTSNEPFANLLLKNVSFYGFKNGYGLILNDSYRNNIENCFFDACGCAVFLVGGDDPVNATSFYNCSIENCALGVVAPKGSNRAVNFYGCTLEGIVIGKKDSAIPSDIAFSEAFSDKIVKYLGVNNVSEVSAAMILVGTTTTISGMYLEDNTNNFFFGDGVVVTITGCYINGGYSGNPSNSIFEANEARCMNVYGNYIITHDDHHIYNIDTSRNHSIKGNFYTQSGAVYTGTLCVDNRYDNISHTIVPHSVSEGTYILENRGTMQSVYSAEKFNANLIEIGNRLRIKKDGDILFADSNGENTNGFRIQFTGDDVSFSIPSKGNIVTPKASKGLYWPPLNSKPSGVSYAAVFLCNGIEWNPFSRSFDVPYLCLIDANGVVRDYDGIEAGVKRIGTFSEKPVGSDVYIGFRYFCTDRKIDDDSSSPTYMQVISDEDGGMDIIFKGWDETDPEHPINIWVDTLGRVVS